MTDTKIEYLEGEYTLVDRPLWWQENGLQQTRSGYGAKLTSRRCVQFPDGRERRVYITQFSNAGSAWITLKGKRLYLRD
jgi:hypothetical protein